MDNNVYANTWSVLCHIVISDNNGSVGIDSFREESTRGGVEEPT